jgi:hypothetical protein
MAKAKHPGAPAAVDAAAAASAPAAPVARPTLKVRTASAVVTTNAYDRGQMHWCDAIALAGLLWRLTAHVTTGAPNTDPSPAMSGTGQYP